jgi:hypothetical protein
VDPDWIQIRIRLAESGFGFENIRIRTSGSYKGKLPLNLLCVEINCLNSVEKGNIPQNIGFLPKKRPVTIPPTPILSFNVGEKQLAFTD